MCTEARGSKMVLELDQKIWLIMKFYRRRTQSFSTFLISCTPQPIFKTKFSTPEIQFVA